MISQQILDVAAFELPKCKMLTDAERRLGGAWDGNRRNQRIAAVTWGLFDGYKGRPKPDSFSLPLAFSIYAEAWEAGRKLSMITLPG